MNFSLAATRDHQTETTHSNHLPPCLLQKSYRPVATLSTVSAMAALIDVTGGVGGGAKGGGGAVEATSPGGGGADEPSSGGGGEEMCKATAAAAARETDEGGDVEDAAGVADDEAVEEVANGTLFSGLSKLLSVV